MVLEALVRSSEDGRVSEGVEGGAEEDGIGSEVSRTDKVCSEFVVAWSCAKVGEEGSGTFGCSESEERS